MSGAKAHKARGGATNASESPFAAQSSKSPWSSARTSGAKPTDKPIKKAGGGGLGQSAPYSSLAASPIMKARQHLASGRPVAVVFSS